MLPAQRLLGKVAIVTGAAKGIGAACARALGAEGAAVAVADIDAPGAAETAAALKADGIKAMPIACDVRLKSEVDAMIAQTVMALGGVDILVANAGIVRAADFLEMTESQFDEVVDVNLKGVFLTCQAAAKQMVAQGRGGAIITMSSVNAVMAIPTIAGYNASKGGVNSLTRCMALALAPHGIRVNGIGPGSIATDVLAAVMNDEAAKQRVLSRTPLGRIGEPEEIGRIASFLASDAASYMTGQILYADGGRLAMNYTCAVTPQK